MNNISQQYPMKNINNNMNLAHLSSEKQNNKNIVLAAVSQNGNSLKYASLRLKNNEYIVKVAVKQDGCALAYASSKLRANRDIVLHAVTTNGIALKYASDELRNDYDIVLAAVKTSGIAFVYASTELHNNLELLNIFKKYHETPETDINLYNYKDWYFEKMKHFNILMEQKFLNDNAFINLDHKNKKTIKF